VNQTGRGNLVREGKHVSAWWDDMSNGKTMVALVNFNSILVQF